MKTTGAAEERISLAMKELYSRLPAIWAVLMNMSHRVSETHPSAATDGRVLILGREFIEKELKNIPEVEYVLAHEAGHIIFKHNLRREGRNPRLWNISGDIAIDCFLSKVGLTAPDGSHEIEQFEGWPIEKIYHMLSQKMPNASSKKAVMQMVSKCGGLPNMLKSPPQGFGGQGGKQQANGSYGGACADGKGSIDNGKSDSKPKSGKKENGKSNLDDDLMDGKDDTSGNSTQKDDKSGNTGGNNDKDNDSQGDIDDSSETEERDEPQTGETPEDDLPDMNDGKNLNAVESKRNFDDVEYQQEGLSKPLEVMDYPGDQEETDRYEDALESHLVNAIEMAKGCGKAPLDMVRAFEKSVEARVDWRDELAHLLQDKIPAPKTDYSKSNFRPVLDPEIMYPENREEKTVRVLIIGDTSGSMSEREVSFVCAEISNLMDTTENEVTVYWVDCKYHNEQTFMPGMPLLPMPKGGGGTSLWKGIEHALKMEREKAQEPFDVIVIITDGDFWFSDWPHECLSYPADLFWVLTPNASASFSPPVGRVMRVRTWAASDQR